MENYRKKVKIESCTICKLSINEIDSKYLEVDHINKNRVDKSQNQIQIETSDSVITTTTAQTSA